VVLGSIIPLALAQQNQTVPLRSIAVITPVPTPIPKPVTPTAVEKSTIIINGKEMNPNNASSGTINAGGTSVTWINQPGSSSMSVSSSSSSN